MLVDYKERILTAETVYFYFVDELTGKVAKSKKYPIKIKKPKEFVKKMKILMHYGLSALTIYNDLAGFCQLLGIPLVGILSGIQSSLKEAFDSLKKNSSVELFDLDSNQKIQKVRGAKLRKLQEFMEENDESRDFAGLERIHDDRGSALWTKVEEKKREALLKERKSLRDEFSTKKVTI